MPRNSATHEEYRTKDEPPQLNPPFGRTTIRCPPQNPDRFLAPKSVPRTPRSQHMIPQGKACHHHPSRHSRTHLQLTRYLKGAANCQCKRHLGEDMENRGIKDTSGTRPRSGHISKSKDTSGARPQAGHLRGMDTYTCGHWTKEHTSRTRTPSEGHVNCVMVGYLYQP